MTKLFQVRKFKLDMCWIFMRRVLEGLVETCCCVQKIAFNSIPEFDTNERE